MLAQTLGDPGFTVANIKVEGLQRVSEGTVFNYLPVNIGDTPERRSECARPSARSMPPGSSATCSFGATARTLVVVVLERPSIESFEITGNKDIKTEDLQKSLRNVGLATGKTFDRSVLEELTRDLTEQYFSRGKYGVRVDHRGGGDRRQPGEAEDRHQGGQAREDPPDQRRRQRGLQREGRCATGFELQTPGWLSFYKQNDRYSRESLQGDLEKLRSFYMDRGYANFQIESTQVAIAPEKDRHLHHAERA